MRLLTSSRADRQGYHPVQKAAQAPILWPRHINGRTQMVPINPGRIPLGWQAIQAHVPSRLATCEETNCPMFLRGWTEMLPADGGPPEPRVGQLDSDQAAAITGYYGPLALAPKVIHHPPGTPCPRIHRTALVDIPPLYTVDGRTVLWTEFEDALGGGIHRIQQIVKEGRY